MSVAVYSRLGDLLQAKGMSAHDLQRQIATRFGLTMGARTLDRLASADRVRRPDLEIAAAAVLNVELGDLFIADTIPIEGDAADPPGDVEQDDVLDPDRGQRLHALFGLQNRRPLTSDEQVELDGLVSAWGRSVSERGMRELARKRGVPIEQVRTDVLTDVDRAAAWWRETQADPARMEQAVREARALRRVESVG